MSPSSLKILALIALLVGSFGCPAKAVVFDWDQSYATWTADPASGASASSSYNFDTNNTGNDMTLRVENLSNSDFNWLGTGMNVGTTPNTGGNVPTQRALQYQVDSGNGTGQNSSGIRTTITFHYQAVTNVSFTLWDVDLDESGNSQWIDVIYQISATQAGGGTVYPTITDGAANNQSGSGATLAVTGIEQSEGTENRANVTISFTGVNITSLTFRWRNGDSSEGNQYIALHDITFTPVPEVGTSLVALGLCGGLMGLARLRRPLAQAG